jgi:hypothetical protein
MTRIDKGVFMKVDCRGDPGSFIFIAGSTVVETCLYLPNIIRYIIIICAAATLVCSEVDAHYSSRDVCHGGRKLDECSFGA